MTQKLMTFLKGMAMGAADVVPGVSGGTIAFITGIYETLLESIRRVNPSLLKRWKNEGFSAAWQYINGTFLIVLLSGILLSIASLAKGITWMLENHPIPIWSFFFGLIVASVLHMMKQVNKWSPATLLAVMFGCVFAYVITVASPIALEPNAFTVLLAGSIAICAMILPGISGSFILLLLGMYGPILSAVKNGDIATLGLFAIGCIAGLLTFSHVLSWLLKRFHALTIAFLTGLMLGTLGKIWPWKQTLTWRTNSSGEQVPLIQENLSPMAFETVTSMPSQIGLAAVAALGGFLLVWGLEKFAPEK